MDGGVRKEMKGWEEQIREEEGSNGWEEDKEGGRKGGREGGREGGKEGGGRERWKE